jgi:hypothetical protein
MIARYLAVIILFVTSASAQVPAPKAIVTPAIYDFGKITAGTVAEGNFTIANNGNAPLEIQRVVASCGCLTPAIPKTTLQPGESEVIVAKFDSKGFFGKQVKNVRLYTNDPQASSLLLTFRGEIAREFKIEPAQFYFGDLLQGTERKVKVNLTSNLPSITIGEVFSKSDLFKVETLASKIDGIESKSIELSVKPDAPQGIVRSIVLVHTNSTNEPVISIPIFIKIQGDLQLSPSYVSFDLLEAPLAEPMTRVVDLKNIGEDSPNIVSIESDNPFVSGKFKVLKPGKLFEIEIRLSEESKGVIRAKLTINTDRLDDSRKSVTLPVYAFVTKKGD